VTCPTTRIHPAVIAQAAATSSVLLDGRFTLGIGTGEALNEHVLGDRWPHAELRLEQLEEAVQVIRALWTGDVISHEGQHYSVDTARLYTLPEEPPQIFMSAFGPRPVTRPSGTRTGSGRTRGCPESWRRYCPRPGTSSRPRSWSRPR
jgi:G6PDH family F420-dependent oxidoreductase